MHAEQNPHSSPRSDEPPTVDARAADLIYLFPGVEGGPFLMRPAVRALRDAGVTADIRVHNWKRPFGIIANLVSHRDNRRMAGRVADDLARYRQQHHDANIDLLGYSGGGGLAIMVAEALPDNFRLHRIVLCQPALCPTYDLTAALRRVDDKLIHFHSPPDWVILGLGTLLLGTMDRRHACSAGRGGFNPRRAVPDAILRKKLIQHRWSPRWIRYHHWGGHPPILFYRWNKACIAPLFITGPPVR